MATARELMTSDATCVGANQTIDDAARMMSELGVGALPICGEDDRLKGMLTDRDIVVKVLAEGRDPSQTRAGDLGQGKPVTIGADDSAQLALQTMAEHKVRRLPVIDGQTLVGVVTQADLATNLDEEATGALVAAVSAAD
jgi:CBS domain-containing protein